jgi:integrase
VAAKKTSGAKRKPGAQWNRTRFRHSILRGCEKANVEKWTPYQLRHAAASEANKLGIEYARALLGHKSIKTTDNYVAQDLGLATDAATRSDPTG